MLSKCYKKLEEKNQNHKDNADRINRRRNKYNEKFIQY